jgi:hypothetical protein
MIQRLIKEDLLAELNLDNIPNIENVLPSLLDPAYDPGNAHSIPYMWGTLGIVVNTEMVEEPVTSWNDLLNEKYAGDFYPVLQHANQIARYCPRLFAKSVYGMICSNVQKLRSTLSAAHKEAVYTPTLTKPLVAIIRMVDMLEAYMKGCPFSGCLTPSNLVDLLHLKKTPTIGSGYIYNSLESLTCAARDLVCRADKEFAGVIDDRIPTFLDATLINLVSLAISSDPDYKEAPHE